MKYIISKRTHDENDQRNFFSYDDTWDFQQASYLPNPYIRFRARIPNRNNRESFSVVFV